MKTRLVRTHEDIPSDHAAAEVFVSGCGPSVSPLMIVGEAPGAEEEKAAAAGRYETIMIGPTGALADKFIRAASGGNRTLRDFYRTNVEKYRPPFNKISNFHLIGRRPLQDVALLEAEIEAIKPRAILAFGGHALAALCGKGKRITLYRGSILENQFTGLPKVIPTFHPAAFLHYGGKEKGAFKVPPHAQHWVIHDIKRALAESEYAPLRLPVRNLEVCRSSIQFERFLKQHAGKRKVSVDVETVKSIPTCIGFAFSSDHAMSVPLLNIDDIQLDPYDHAILLSMVAEILSNPYYQLIGQNWKFDQYLLEHVWGFKLPRSPWMDTAMAAHTLYPENPKKLEFLTSIFTREPYYKSELKEFDYKKQRYSEILLYNAKDVAIPFEIAEKFEAELEERHLTSFFHTFIMPLHEFYMDLESAGMLVDNEKRLHLWRKYTAIEVAMQEELEALAGKPINIRSSTKDIPEFVAFLGLPERKSYDENNLVALIGNHCKKDHQRRGLDLVLALRKVKRMKSAYLAAKPDYDGRMRTLVNINGTENGRTSTNILKPPSRPHKVGMPFQTLTKRGEFGPEIQEIFYPDPGHCFLEIDQSQAEARAAANYANDAELLEQFDTIDIHRLTAAWFLRNMGKEIDHEILASISKDERFIGKMIRYAGNLGAAKHTAMLNINADARKLGIPVTLSEKQAGEYLRIFHAFNPKIKSVFHASVVNALRTHNFVLTGPLGRQRMFMGYFDDSMKREAAAFMVQEPIADQTKKAGMLIKKKFPSLAILIEAHDGLKVMPEISQLSEVAAYAQECFELPIDFSSCSVPRAPLVIPCELKVGYENLRLMEDYSVR